MSGKGDILFRSCESGSFKGDKSAVLFIASKLAVGCTVRRH